MIILWIAFGFIVIGYIIIIYFPIPKNLAPFLNMGTLASGWFSWPFLTTLIAGFSISIILAVINYHHDEKQALSEFQRAADNQAAVVLRQIDLSLSILSPTAGFFLASKQVTWNEFKVFSENAISHNELQQNSVNWLLLGFYHKPEF